jgi:tetratricopeptide (TPR) repeat protein
MLADYADTLVHNSMADQAVEKMELALHLNPIPPDTYLWIAAGADFLRADFEAALSKLKHMSNQDQGYRLMAASAAMLGDQVAARTYRHAALSIDPAFKISEWIQRLPLKEAHHLELYVSALKKAGFR